MHGQKALTVVAALLSGMTLCYAATASAQEAPVFVYGDASGARTERVAFADLNLASAAGKARLLNRVGAAIERVCDLELGRDGLQDRGYYACADAAGEAAEPQIAEAIASGKTALGAAIMVVGR